ncbi:MAG: hypothetical protein ACFWTN_04160 [Clostridium sp.]
MHFCTLTAQKSTDKYCALYILGTILLENVIVVLYDMSRLSKQKSQAPGLARKEICTRVDEDKENRRFGGCLAVWYYRKILTKNKKRFLNKVNRVP